MHWQAQWEKKKSIQDEDKVREMLFINFVFHFVWKFSIQVLSILKSIIKNIQFIEKCILFSNMHKFSNMLNLWNQSWFSCMDCCVVWPEEKWPPDWAWFLPRFFSPFCHQWSFGSLPLSPLACLVGDTSFPAISSTWLNRNFLNWTELDDAITEFNNEMPLTENWVLNLVILHYWHYFPILILCSCFVTICIVKSAI